MKNTFQSKVRKFIEKNSMHAPIEYRMLDLTNEIGEVAKEICKMSNYGRKKPRYRKEIELELGDAFYSLITVANYYNIDLDNSLKLAIKKYKKRIRKHGHAGSETNP